MLWGIDMGVRGDWTKCKSNTMKNVCFYFVFLRLEPMKPSDFPPLTGWGLISKLTVILYFENSICENVFHSRKRKQLRAA